MASKQHNCHKNIHFHQNSSHSIGSIQWCLSSFIACIFISSSSSSSFFSSSSFSSSSSSNRHKTLILSTLNHKLLSLASFYSILILIATLNSSQLLVDAIRLNADFNNTAHDEKWLKELPNISQNHTLMVRPTLYIISNAHLFLQIKIIDSHPHHKDSYERSKLLKLFNKTLKFKLEPLQHDFVESNLTVSWHINTNINHSLIEHRHIYHTATDNVKQFFERLHKYSLSQSDANSLGDLFFSSMKTSSLASPPSSSSSSSSSSSAYSLNWKDIPNKCQFWRGKPLKYSQSQPSFNPLHSATFSICEDGYLNGFVNWFPYGQILLQPNRQSKCFFWKSRNVLKKNKNTLTKTKKESIKETFFKKHIIVNPLLTGCIHELSLLSIPLPIPKELSNNYRSKRSTSLERNIEILVVADESMEEYHGRSLQSYILTLMAGVAHIFEHSSIGNEINIRIVRLHIGKDDDLTVWPNWSQSSPESSSAQTALRRFCKWQYENNYGDDNDPKHHDTAILLTRRDLCRNSATQNSVLSAKKGRTLCDTLGLAHSGRICDPESSCAIVEDNGLSAAFTIAHELGHVLGVPHDEEEKCRTYYNTTEGKEERLKWSNLQKGFKESNVMARMIDYHSHMWSWSPCSKHYITEFLDSGHGDCLIDKNSENQLEALSSSSSPSSTSSTSSLTGIIEQQQGNQKRRSLARMEEFYDPNKQCVLVYGPNSTLCTDMPTCRRLWCRTPESLGCKTQHMPWAEGTECAPERWCQEGECVAITKVPPINGGWGNWSEFSECSLPCGGGIRRSKRECDQPSPQNGGLYCLGMRIQYESCNRHPCPVQKDVRAEQCATFNGKTFNIPGIAHDVVWTPEYNGILEHERCKLHCVDSASGKSFMLQERVIDGTPCSNDSFDICVNGNCLSAGCDRILGSDKQLDICGICGGNNSTCDKIRGNFQPKTVEHGYNKILKIPSGASNIEIRKEHSSTSSSDNWLAMRTESGEYLLNGKFVVNMYRRKWEYAGTTIEYSGVHNQTMEMINSTRTISKPLFIELLCVGELTPPVIEYRYSLEKKSNKQHNNASRNENHETEMTAMTEIVNYEYRWKSVKHKHCNRVCQGEMTFRSKCVLIRIDSNGKNVTQYLSDNYCLPFAPKPDPKMRACNLDCELRWDIENIGDCSSKCGPGTRPRKVSCRRISLMTGGKSFWMSDNNCKQLVKMGKLERKPDAYEVCNGTECKAIYQWQTHTWTRCNIAPQTCGIGVQSRQIDCLQSVQYDNGEIVSQIVDPILCTQPIPEMNRSCTVECPYWRIGNWSNCSAIQCGIPGKIQRSLECIHIDHVVNDEYCLALPQTKPETSQFCMIQCPTTTTALPTTTSTTTLATILTTTLTLTSTSTASLPTSSITNTITSTIISTTTPSTTSLSSITNEATSVLNEDVNYQNSYMLDYSNEILNIRKFIWIHSNWTSCRPLYDHLSLFESRLMKHYSLPKCFNSTYSYLMFEQQFKALILLNQTFTKRSFEKLRNLIRVEKDNLKRKRHIECVDSNNNNRKYFHDYCDPTTKPEVEQFCPIFDHYRPVLKDYEIRNCTFISTTTTASTSIIPSIIDKVSPLPPPPLSSSLSLPPPSPRPPPKVQASSLSFVFSESANLATVAGRRTPTSTLSNTFYEYLSDIMNNTSIQPSKWNYSEWTECQPKCDLISILNNSLNKTNSPNGSRKRKAQCLDKNHILINDSYCIGVPVLIENCFSSSKCDNIVWKSDHWSECNKPCGNGTQFRQVTCHLLNSHGFENAFPLNDAHCSNINKPETIRNCNVEDCSDSTLNEKIFVWHTFPWEPCSTSCGKGIQKRKLICIDFQTGYRVHDAQCRFKKKPEIRRYCNKRSCSILSCKDIHDRSMNSIDGDYEIWIQNVKVKVFCKAMQTGQPVEYLKLLVEEDNFSQFYQKKNCNNEEIKFRTYYFNYVRLNLTSLQIIVSDTSFSFTIHRNQKRFHTQKSPLIGFGESIIQGCVRQIKNNQIFPRVVSLQECNYGNGSHFGKFSINLENTGLAISPIQEWINNPTIEIIDQKYTKLIGECHIQKSKQIPINGKCQHACLPERSIIQLLVP